MPSENNKNRTDRRCLALRSAWLPLACAILTACSTADPNPLHLPLHLPQRQPVDNDPMDIVPVARFTTPVNVDDMARCIGEGWARLSVIGDGKVTLHPGLRGLIVDVKAASDPLARVYAEVYPFRGVTRVDYYIRSFVSDPIENLRLRALQQCLMPMGSAGWPGPGTY